MGRSVVVMHGSAEVWGCHTDVCDLQGHKGAKKSSINHHLNRYLTKVPGAQKKK